MGTVKTEIMDAVRSAGSSPSEPLVRALSNDAQIELAVPQFDRLRAALRKSAKHVDRNTQLPLPGFEALHAFYPNAIGVITPLADLSPEECLLNADRLDAEAGEWDVPRQRDQGALKRREAEQLRRWANRRAQEAS
jgi:hypothetical protein